MFVSIAVFTLSAKNSISIYVLSTLLLSPSYINHLLLLLINKTNSKLPLLNKIIIVVFWPDDT